MNAHYTVNDKTGLYLGAKEERHVYFVVLTLRGLIDPLNRMQHFIRRKNIYDLEDVFYGFRIEQLLLNAFLSF